MVQNTLTENYNGTKHTDGKLQSYTTIVRQDSFLIAAKVALHDVSPFSLTKTKTKQKRQYQFH